jgi:CRISPR type IV-associated protein Csf2
MAKTTAAAESTTAIAANAIVLDGKITAITPISISQPLTPEQARSRQSSGDRVTRLPRMPMFVGGEVVSTVYLPASTLRGAMRHAATDRLIEALAETDKRLTVSEYMAAALGGIKDRKGDGEETRGVDLAAFAAARRDNPIISVFGSFAQSISGNLAVGMAIPEQPFIPATDDIVTGVRQNALRKGDIANKIDAADLATFMEADRATVKAVAMKGGIGKLEAKLRVAKREKKTDEMAEINAEIEAQKTAQEEAFSESGRSVNLQQVLPGFEFIPSGCVMTQRTVLRKPSIAELGVLLSALEHMARNPIIGGQSARGCGQYTASWRIGVQPPNGPMVGVGTIEFDLYAGININLLDVPEAKLITKAKAYADSLGDYVTSYKYA